MADPVRFFRVTVEQTWTAEAEFLVAADDIIDAQFWAETEADFSFFDAEEIGGPIGRATPVPIEDLPALLDDPRTRLDVTLLAVTDLPVPSREASGPGARRTTCDDLNVKQFRERFLSPEAIEAHRLARVEADNGQITLPLP